MRKKKEKLIIKLSIICLLILLIWQIKNSRKTNLEYDFAISDTASITKIFLADMQGNNITLDKKYNSWRVNNNYNVKNSSMKTILHTIKNISVQRPIPENNYNQVIKNLAANGVKIEIYIKNEKKPIKTYTIGNNTSDHAGTYMLLSGSKQPYIMNMVGFNGVLGPRYGIQGQRIDYTVWRDRSVFNLNAQKIKSLRMINIKGNDSSFTIKKVDEKFILLDFQNRVKSIKEEKLITYLNLFNNINCEAYRNEDARDKLTDEKKIFSLIIEHNNGIDSLDIYEIRSKGEPRQESEKYTAQRMYANNNSGDIMLIQNYVFNKLLININELIE